MEIFIGGTGSGKSEMAEKRVCELAETENLEKIYLATMKVYGEEGIKRVERHKKLRAGKGFKTIEKTENLDEIEIEKNSVVLLECLSNLTANEMFSENGIIPAEQVAEKIINNITTLSMNVEHLIIVTINVFNDGEQYDEGTLEYIRALSLINTELSKRANHMVEAVAGIAVEISYENKIFC